MEIRQLEAFAAVLSTGSVTAAGRLLDRSQPVISRQVQDLEQELGFTLFERTRPSVTLTEQGRQFYEEMQHVLAGLQQLDVRSREIAQGQARPLKIVATYALSTGLLPGVLGELNAMHSRGHPGSILKDQKIYIDSLAPERVAKTVATGQATLGLTSLPIDLKQCRLHWSGEAPCVLAMSSTHALAQETTIALAQLRDTPIITMSSRNRLRHRLSTALLHDRGTRAPRHIETNSTLNALALVRANLGVAIVEPFTGVGMPPDGVVFRPIDTAIPFQMGAITHREQALADDVLCLIDMLKRYAQQHIPGFKLNSESRNRALLNSLYESPAIEDIAIL
ncbi:LysR family transcriptional regulator [Paralcaligenes sp. KSB-10]|uniref:LysR family transcriptional regulator n=1 Tax=Paralcaligenes sp. KSB-10 TaxID=2901142 RepID=UPI001E502401|nr:LysR family transcriptional regulator [Paralcaligenes sp. KSB-10]UHL62967.1 LysR family transcriptional regulator [Paralcaligenes sp. KSB-10]